MLCASMCVKIAYIFIFLYNELSKQNGAQNFQNQKRSLKTMNNVRLHPAHKLQYFKEEKKIQQQFTMYIPCDLYGWYACLAVE